jgi:hypothetical protein
VKSFLGALACESASVRQVARQFRLAASTVRAIELRYLPRWNATRRRERLEQMRVDDIYFGKQRKFITAVSNLENCEPLWFGRIASKKRSMSSSERK